ncbi:AraC family transcriptional regulator [Chitinophaga barathri]|uniref:AraC family transcriptional regulator n=1 Tax=Chitinophaga barathri TaxID=1647451 RepID=A0A3N4M9G7_9BACT|nr:AraC family transcriptional regulator [Chitinophaga barathri]RPD38266.1 AraC family transcriptional regulator [Chitinophaga barathri]
MKVLQFTIPVAPDKNIILQNERLPYFYPHLHRHSEVQLTWIQQGSGTLVADNSMHAFRPGEIYWLAGNQPHVFRSDRTQNDSGSQSFTLFFDPAGRLAPVFALAELKPVQAFIERFPRGFKLPDRVAPIVGAMMQQLDKTKGAAQFAEFIRLLGYLRGITDLEPLVTGTKPAAVNEQEGLRIGAIYDYIMKHYETDIPLDDIARHANMTPQAFCRYFKKHTRLTFVEFLHEVRVHEASKLLAGGAEESIASIAYRCGFNSIATFNRVFKTVTGLAPREYVREMEK